MSLRYGINSSLTDYARDNYAIVKFAIKRCCSTKKIYLP